LLSLPPTGFLHAPLPLHLTIRNRDPSLSYLISVSLEPDPTGFVVAGLRSGKVQILMPGQEEKVCWCLVPVECGVVKVPKVKVVGRREEGEGGEDVSVRVVDVRWDMRREPRIAPSTSTEDEGKEEPLAQVQTIAPMGDPRVSGTTSILVYP
jgi:trafficking protein particle complex subunit 11